LIQDSNTWKLEYPSGEPPKNVANGVGWYDGKLNLNLKLPIYLYMGGEMMTLLVTVLISLIQHK
jgi:hypothetical protein